MDIRCPPHALQKKFSECFTTAKYCSNFRNLTKVEGRLRGHSAETSN
jgi:hypothetical protein